MGGEVNLPEQFTRARTLITEWKYEEAVEELRSKLVDYPGSIDGTVLLATVLAEHLDAPDEALAATREILDCPGWQPGRERLVMLNVDLLLDRGAHGEAIGVLERNMRAACNDEPARASLAERLQYLREGSENT